jgi:RimJ/RimL family protein N-acetyltransferase
MIIETSRLLIRSPKENDFKSALDIWSNPIIRKYSGGPANIEQFKKSFFADLGSSKTPLGFRSVVETSSGRHIGDCALIEKKIDLKLEVEIIYFFNLLYWGKAFATEAANALLEYAKNKTDLSRIVAFIHPENTNSEKVAKKIGLNFEKEVITDSGNNRKLYSTQDTLF